MGVKEFLPPGSDEAIEAGCENRWAKVPGYEGSHEVSEDGRVRSLNWEGRRGVVRELAVTIRKGRGNAVGYRVVRICTGKAATPFPVGRLVLSSFTRPPAAGEEQNHKDGNTLNDTIGNLEWVTRSQNQKHAITNGLATPPPCNANSGERFVWKHIDGRVFFGTPPMLARAFSLSGYMDISYLYKMTKPLNYPSCKTYKGWRVIGTPPPGSDDAVAINCKCPVMDNAHGKGYMGGVTDDKGQTVYIFSGDCPLHGEGR